MFSKALAVSLPRPDVVPVMTQTFLSVGIEFAGDDFLNISNIILKSVRAFNLANVGTKALLNVARARNAMTVNLDITVAEFKLMVAHPVLQDAVFQ